MKVYYKTERGVLYHGDCLKVLKQLPDKSVDLVLTDPPYGMKYKSNHYKNGNPFGEITGDNKYPVEILDICFRLAKRAVFSFCRWDNLHEVPKPKSFIVWLKNNWSAGDLNHEYARMWEGILFYPLDKHFFHKRLPDVVDSRRVPPTKLVHPTQKPEILIRSLINNNTNETDLVLDPFLGSGTTAVACEALGRRWIGIEISEKYCEIAKERIEAEIAQRRLF